MFGGADLFPGGFCERDADHVIVLPCVAEAEFRVFPDYGGAALGVGGDDGDAAAFEFRAIGDGEEDEVVFWEGP